METCKDFRPVPTINKATTEAEDITTHALNLILSLNLSPYIQTVAGSNLQTFENNYIIFGCALAVTDVCFLTIQVGLSQMRSHTAACSKYQEYIEEGVRTTAQSQPAVIR